jgi:hypothetical protein
MSMPASIKVCVPFGASASNAAKGGGEVGGDTRF